MKKIIGGFVLLCLILFLAFIAFNFRKVSQVGYCPSIERSLSDSELVEISVRREFQKIDFEGKYHSSEESVHKFYDDHKNCCSIERENENFFGRLIGENYALVNMYFKRNRKNSDPDGEKFYEAHVEVSACGNIKRVYGTSIEEKSIPKEEK